MMSTAQRPSVPKPKSDPSRAEGKWDIHRILMNFPVINLIYELIDERPTIESLKELLNLLGM